MLRAKVSTQSKLFLNSLRVRKQRAKREAIYSVAGLIRTDARRSLKIRPGKSKPGGIPKAHTKGGLRVIAFAVSALQDQAIIGPVKFPRSNRYTEPVPHFHEFGKTVLDVIRLRVKRYPARPYMSRTLQRLNKKGAIPRQFSASVARVL